MIIKLHKQKVKCMIAALESSIEYESTFIQAHNNCRKEFKDIIKTSEDRIKKIKKIISEIYQQFYDKKARS